MDDMIFGDILLPIPQHPKADRLRENAATYANLLAKSEEVKISLDYLKAIYPHLAHQLHVTKTYAPMAVV